MDRELLIEIGVEELPAAWMPALTRQLGERLEARLKEARIARAAVEVFSTPRRLTRGWENRRTAGRPRGGRDRTAGVRGVRCRGAAHAGRRRFCQEAGGRCRGSGTRPVGARGVPDVSEASARQERDRRAARRARRRAARSHVPQADEVGRDDRRRPRRVRVRTPDPLAVVPLWRPGGPVHDRARPTPRLAVQEIRPAR